MRNGMPIHVLAIIALSLVLSFVVPLSAAEEPPPYEVVEIGTLAEKGVTYAYALNNSGVVVGGSMVRLPNGVVGYHAFRWSDGVIEDLNVAEGYGFASGINDAGKIVGVFRRENDPFTRAFLMDPDGTISGSDLFTHRVDPPLAINDFGEFIGATYIGNYQHRAFLSDGIQVTDLHPPGAISSYTVAINNLGDVVGRYELEGYCRIGFLWSQGEFTDFSGCFEYLYPADINDLGQILLNEDFGNNSRALVYEDGNYQDLGTLGGDASVAFSINNKGQIVGFSNPAPGVFASHAFIYMDGTMYDLNDYIPSDSPWELREARDINDRGQVLAFALNTDTGRPKWVLVTPASCLHQVEHLIQDLQDMDIPGWNGQVLLRIALRALENDPPRTEVANLALQFFIYFVNAQSGRRIPVEDAEYLINAAQSIIDGNCL